MRKSFYILLSVAVMLFARCKDNETSNDEDVQLVEDDHRVSNRYEDENELKDDDEVEEEDIDDEEFDAYRDEYPDGKYVADIDYKNPETGFSNSYRLDVEVRDGKLIEIDFNNGGWLDDSHFSSEILSNGKASITDDRGREFDVELKRFKY